MITDITQFTFWLSFIWFLIAIFVAWYIPGSFIIRQFKLPQLSHTVLSLGGGLILWGWVAYIFGIIGIRWMTYVYLLSCFIIWVYISRKSRLTSFWLKTVLRSLPSDKIALGIVIVGFCMQMSVLWFMAKPIQGGVLFCCGDSNDNFWFASLTQELTERIPPQQPGMEGVLVQNYHYWSNLVVAELVRVFRLPLLATQFQFSSIFLSLMLGGLVITFNQLLSLPRSLLRWMLFFFYMGGDSIYVLLLLLGKGLNFSMSSLEDGARFLGNLPRAYSVIVFLMCLNIFLLWLKKKDWRIALLLILGTSSLVVYKVYVGIFLLVGFGFVSIIHVLKKDFRLFFVTLCSSLLALMLYLPTNSSAGGLYLTGFWRFRDFIVQPALGLSHLELARVIFAEHNNWPRLIVYELLFLILYLFSIFGTKLVGIVQNKQSLSVIPRDINLFLLSGLSMSAVFGLFFQQKTGTSNTFNFLVSVFIFGSIYTALASWYWFGRIKKSIRYILIALLVLITIPRALYESTTNIKRARTLENVLVVPWSHIDTITYAKTHSDLEALFLVDYDAFTYDLNAPAVRLLLDRPVFYSGRGILKVMGADDSYRHQEVEIILKSLRADLMALSIERNNIDYILLSSERAMPQESTEFLDSVFKNSHSILLKVDHERIKEKYLKSI